MSKENQPSGNKIGNFFKAIGADLADIGTTFTQGNWMTKVSFLIMGFGPLLRKQFLRGIALLLTEIAFIFYMVSFGAGYLKDITTLGTQGRGFNPDGTVSYGDNSFFILLYSILSIIIVFAFIFVWRINVRQKEKASDCKAGFTFPAGRTF